MNQKDALAALRKGDHIIFTTEHAQKIAKAFELEIEPKTYWDTRSQFKGLTLKDSQEGGRGRGYSAHVLAMDICDHLKLEYPPMHGVGSQLMVCCDVIGRRTDT